MNRNFIFIGLILGIILIIGCVQQTNKIKENSSSATILEVPSSPAKLDISGENFEKIDFYDENQFFQSSLLFAKEQQAKRADGEHQQVLHRKISVDRGIF